MKLFAGAKTLYFFNYFLVFLVFYLTILPTVVYCRWKGDEMNSFEAMAIRIENAHNAFVASVVEQFGYTKAEAEQILAVYLKHKIIKVNPVGGGYSLTHGAFWEKAPMDNALAIAEGSR